MKLGVAIPAFREKHIVSIVQQFEGIADKIVVTCPKVSWYGDMENDDTAERAVRKTSAIVIQQEWKVEHEQRNFMMNLLKDMDYVLTSHCDTWFTREDLLKLKELTLTDLHYTSTVLTYWKDYEHVIDPNIGLPTLLVRSDAVFTNMINIQDQVVDPSVLPIRCYHTSWVDPKLVQKKISTYSHAREIKESWYNDVYLNFKEGMKDFAPTTPYDYKSLRIDPIPDEIREKII